MTQAFVLMTALPPTYGHLDLIKFAGNLSVDLVTVLLNTQPEEPMVSERALALMHTLSQLDRRRYVVRWQNEATQQEPVGDDDAFWANWVGNLRRYGFRDGDYIVASEPYGVTLAEKANGVFMPYDRDRWSRYTKGTKSRNDPYRSGWSDILPEFRKSLQKTVTVFGAESTGKTTLTAALADRFYDDTGITTTKLFEWARPYLEMVGSEVTLDKMNAILEGQYALQMSAYDNALAPLVVQDTDLYSTIGYWENWSPNTTPKRLYVDAKDSYSDLYLITRSNIPFEADPLRYGGDKRETTDQYWIDLCERFGLCYVILESSTLEGRLGEACYYVSKLFEVNPLGYKRIGAEYE